MPGRQQNRPMSTKRKFVKDGLFYAELNDFLAIELGEEGYAGVAVRVTPQSTEIYIRATKTQEVVGENGRRIRELTALIQQRFKFKPGSVELFAEKVKNKGLSALAQAEAVRYRLLEGFSVRKSCFSVVRFIKESGANGCEVVVSGKLRGQRAKSMKFREGYMIHAGDAVNYYIDTAVKHVHLRQGVLGIKVKIMMPYDQQGQLDGCPRQLPDFIRIKEPKEWIDPNIKEQLEAVSNVNLRMGMSAPDQYGAGQQPADAYMQQVPPQQPDMYGGGGQAPQQQPQQQAPPQQQQQQQQPYQHAYDDQTGQQQYDPMQQQDPSQQAYQYDNAPQQYVQQPQMGMQQQYNDGQQQVGYDQPQQYGGAPIVNDYVQPPPQQQQQQYNAYQPQQQQNQGYDQQQPHQQQGGGGGYGY